MRPPTKSFESIVPPGLPITTTWLRRSPPGLRSTGFIAASGSTPAATAWIHWARPISAPRPSGVAQTIELLDMFCALNGATFTPRRANARHSAVVTMVLPASDVVPATSSAAHAASLERPGPDGLAGTCSSDQRAHQLLTETFTAQLCDSVNRRAQWVL